MAMFLGAVAMVMPSALNDSYGQTFDRMSESLAVVAPSPERDVVAMILVEGKDATFRGDIDLMESIRFENAFKKVISDGIITEYEVESLGNQMAMMLDDWEE